MTDCVRSVNATAAARGMKQLGDTAKWLQPLKAWGASRAQAQPNPFRVEMGFQIDMSARDAATSITDTSKGTRALLVFQMFWLHGTLASD